MTDDRIDLTLPYSYLLRDEYMECNTIARSVYTEETAIQAGTATLFIQACNLRKNNPKLPKLLKELQYQVDRLTNMNGCEEAVNKYRSDLASMLRVHYAPAITNYPKLGKFIEIELNRFPDMTFSEAKGRIDEYLQRNHLELEFQCILRDIENTDGTVDWMKVKKESD